MPRAEGIKQKLGTDWHGRARILKKVVTLQIQLEEFGS